MKEKINIISTLGPTSINEKIVRKLDDAGVTHFRINCSHVNVKDYEKIVKKVQSWTDVPICPDTEGAQLRTGEIKNNKKEMFFNKHSIIDFVPNYNKSLSKLSIPLNVFNPSEILREGDILKLDFDSAVVQIIKCDGDIIKGRVLSPGIVKSNKGISSDRLLDIPAITQKDEEIIKIANELKQKYVFLSFCSSPKNVTFLRKKYKFDVNIISKIESAAALNNIKLICKESEGILIDRGDLSRDVPLEKIAIAQKYIMEKGHEASTPVYVATNLMESMLENSKPTRAEVHDIVSTLNMGAKGLVLAAETAIGKYPVESVRIMAKIIKENSSVFLSKDKNISDVNYLTMPSSGRIIEPHGGELVNQYFDINKEEIKKIPKLLIDDEKSSDISNICNGTFSPVRNFMNIEEIDSVLLKNKLLNDVAWTMPIIFQITNETFEELKNLDNNKIGLLTKNQNTLFATIEIDKIETDVNLNKIANMWFGTDDTKHPGVSKFYEKGNIIISGKPRLNIGNKHFGSQYKLTPKQTRELFNHNGWHDIIGFHTRNIPHKGHEYIQREALERYNADAILISPVTGKKKSGDFNGDFIIECYNELITSGSYDPFEVVLSAFHTYSRYAGPKEAIFTAICRKNYGCNSFIVGRDHTGFGNYFSNTASHEIFDTIDLEMNIIKFDTVNYCKNRKIYTSNFKNHKDHEVILSGTRIRNAIQKNEYIPNYVLSSQLYDYIIKKLNAQPDSLFEP